MDECFTNRPGHRRQRESAEVSPSQSVEPICPEREPLEFDSTGIQDNADAPLPAMPDPIPVVVTEIASRVFATPEVGPLDASQGFPVIDGYEILGMLGRGGMGVVYRAWQAKLNRVVALKMILAGSHAGPEELSRFRIEAEAAARLQHPNIVQIHAIGEQDGLPYFAMECVDGESLRQLVARAPLPTRRAAQLIAALARAVHYAHGRGVIHRDLSPENVLLSREPGHSSGADRGGDDAELDNPKITDFGLAKLLVGPGLALTRTNGIVGTPSYMAPEQASGGPADVGPSTDVYALGAMLYELLAGRPPFRSDSPLETVRQVLSEEPLPLGRLQPKLPCDLGTICLKCLQKDPSRRYATAGALADDLQRFLDGRPIQARPAGLGERCWRWCRRNPAMAASGGLAVAAWILVLVVSVGFALYQSQVATRLRQAQQQTQSAWRTAEMQRLQAERTSASATLDRALLLCQQEEIASGTLWLARSLEMAANAGADDLEWAIRTNIAGWRPRLRPLLSRLQHHGGVLAVAFSPDDQTVLTGADDYAVRLWDVASEKLRIPPMRHDGEVLAVAFSPDGRILLTGSDDRSARLWDAATGQAVCSPLEHDATVSSVAFGSEPWIVTGSQDGTVRTWNRATGKVGVVLRHEDAVNGIAVSPDGHLILSGSNDRSARVWELTTGMPLARLPHDEAVRAVAFSPDGSKFVTASDDYTVRLWDSKTAQQLGPRLRPGARVRAVAWSPDGTMLVTGTVDGSAQIWDVATGQSLGAPIHHQDIVWSLALSHDGSRIVTGSADRTAQVWRVSTDEPVRATFRHRDRIEVAIFSPDGKTVLTGGKDRTAQLWDATTGKPIGPPLEHRGPVVAAAFSPDSRVAVTASDDGSARIWDAATADPIGPPLHHDSWVNAVAFSPDGRTIVTGSRDGTARLWDATTNFRETSLRHTQGVKAVTFRADSQVVATGCADGTARLWDMLTGQLVCPPLRHADQEALISLSFSPSGQTLLTASWDGTARMWDVATGKAIGQPMEHQARISAAVFSPDGRTVLTGSWDRTARLWDARTGKPTVAPLSLQGAIWAVAFSPDNRIVAIAGDDQTARLWDSTTGKPLGPPLRHQSVVRTVAFSPDARTLLTGSWDGTARIWKVPVSIEGSTARIVHQTELITGMKLDQNAARALDQQAWSVLVRDADARHHRN